MSRLFATALIAAMLAAARPAAAEPAPNCDAAVNTHDLNRCADAEYQAADAELNAAYKKALEHIKKNGAEPPYDAASWENALRTSQKAWIAFRDADCKGLTPMSWSGGTGTTSAVLGCLTTKTKARTLELRDLYDER